MTTGSSAKDGVSDKLMKAAEAHAEQRIEELSYDHSKRKKALIKFGAMGVFTAIIVFFATIAWFTMNESVMGGSMAVTAGTENFDIATKGAQIRYEDVLTVADDGYSEGVNTTISGTGYYTSANTEKLMLRYDTGYSEIGPGDSGSLSLYVIPRNNNAQEVDLSLRVIPFAEIEVKQNGEPVYKTDPDTGDFILDDTTGQKIPETVIVEVSSAAALLEEADWLTAAEAQTYVNAAAYLRSHIMFFGAEGNTTTGAESTRYYYSTPYTDRTITATIPANNKDKPVQVPLFWMWPNTLGQLALPDASAGNRSGYPIVADSDTTGRAAIKQYMIDELNTVFADVSTLGINAAMINTVTSGYQKVPFETLSKGYNRADLAIGMNIAYFMIEVTVTQ